MSIFSEEVCPGCGEEGAILTIDETGEVIIDCDMCDKTFIRVIKTTWEEVLGP
jgi:hypothetical protein